MSKRTCGYCGHWQHSHVMDRGLCEVWDCQCDEFERETKHERGAVMIEMAIALPLLIMLMVGGLIMGVATIQDVQLERAVADAAEPYITQAEAGAIVAEAKGTMTCYWRGSGPGGCYGDGLTVERTQVQAVGDTLQHPVGAVTPKAQAVVVVEPPTTVTSTP